MARTKNRARRGPAGQAIREAAKSRQGQAKGDQEKKVEHGGISKPKKNKNKIQNKQQKFSKQQSNNAADTPSQNASQPSVQITLPSLDPELASSYDVSSMSIISSSPIEKKVTAILTRLNIYPAITPATQAVVMLHSRAKVASKLISVVEIAKREIGAAGAKWFQYNAIEQTMVERHEGEIEKGQGNGEGEGKGVEENEGDDEEEEEEEGFETMKTPFERVLEGKPKTRAEFGMVVYLSRVRIDALRKKYGEQTNAIPASD